MKRKRITVEQIVAVLKETELCDRPTGVKRYLLAFCLAGFSGTICAQQADPCTALVGPALDQCQVNQQKLQQQQLTQQQQQLTQLQEQQAQQQKQLAQQQEQLTQQQKQLAKQQEQRRQDELLRKQLEHDKSANQPAAAAATDYSKSGELKSWKADNHWFGSDYARTQFAMRYAKQLQQERPDLAGRPFLDAISDKVRDTFGASR